MEKAEPEKWSFCGVCRRNHEERRKHIFSSHHKAKLAAILTKFSKKVHSARRCLGRPSVVDGELEPGEAGKMWCYCCEKEVQKHVTDGRTSIEWAGLLEHMTGPEHHKLTRRFWWLNGADSNKMQTFLLYTAEYRRYKELAFQALSKLEEQRQAKLKQLAVELRTNEECRALLALEPPPGQQQSSKQPKHCVGKREPRHVSWSVEVSKKRAKAGHASSSEGQSSDSHMVGHGLTSITPKQVPGVRGNVHTGATPPWLRDDGSNDAGGSMPSLIGPSVDEFILHRERKKRAGKDPRRVGADFHIKLATQKQPDSDDWLPAFGRVWNHGPRLHSKKEYLLERTAPGASSSSVSPGNMQILPSTSDSTSHSSTHMAMPPLTRPYVRERTSIGITSVSHQSSNHSTEGSCHPLVKSHDPPSNLSPNLNDTHQIQLGGRGLETGLPSAKMGSEVKPYIKKRAWDADLQRFVINHVQ